MYVYTAVCMFVCLFVCLCFLLFVFFVCLVVLKLQIGIYVFVCLLWLLCSLCLFQMCYVIAKWSSSLNNVARIFNCQKLTLIYNMLQQNRGSKSSLHYLDTSNCSKLRLLKLYTIGRDTCPPGTTSNSSFFRSKCCIVSAQSPIGWMGAGFDAARSFKLLMSVGSSGNWKSL